MDPMRSNKNFQAYLPSKKMQIALAVILVVLLGYFLLPSIISGFRNLRTRIVAGPKPPEPSLVVTTAADEGIPDWQKLLLGLDPDDPASDTEFENRKRELESQGLWENIYTVSETDQLGITIGSALAEIGTNVSDETIGLEITAAVEKYITTLDTSLKVYTKLDITEDPVASSEADARYIRNLEPIVGQSFITESNMEIMQGYFLGTHTRIQVEPLLRKLSETIEQLLIIPVPPGPRDIHIRALNHLYSLHQIIDRFETEFKGDDVRVLAAVALAEQKINAMVASGVDLNNYFIFNTQTQ